ncbi:hypothetical protein Ctob_004649 [Chrysochromulina tobinii]|uniref:Uncharacterized protein n=1 Tax=Chrysochromulina tobinii TaxID=1460289 RepID=A0A0M0JPB4_9EUKA|nr:hypothetical protein Ctob_004649 [Chrysochromulina tobinii]|eukprot:KOO28335.1 hypothetical protein Ctob_004649 [Chrysochromulina sp. CCMP291]
MSIRSTFKAKEPPISHDGLKVKVLGKRRKDFFSTFIPSILQLSAPALIFMSFVIYICCTLFFAFLFYAQGADCFVIPTRPTAFHYEAFWLSVQTFSTVGFGSIYPICFSGHLVVVFECFSSLIVTAILGGAIFFNVMLPRSRIRFSKQALVDVDVHPRTGTSYKMITFRLVRESDATMRDANIRVQARFIAKGTDGEKDDSQLTELKLKSSYYNLLEHWQSRDAGIICLGDFWHAGGMLHTRQLNRILDEIRRWDMPVLMIPGNHDQAMRGNPDPLLHALTPLGLASPSTIRTSMAEAGQRKALLVLDRERGWAVEDEVPLDLGPRHHVLRAPLHEQLLTLAPALRQGDRLLLLSAEPDLLQPAALFAAYADAKNLSAPLRALATTLLDASLTAAGSAFVPPPPVRLSLSSVSVEGFGCFESALVYPLERRGLLLLRGATASESNNAGAGADVSDEGDDGEVTASNGAGKTTLAMAPLWALTGSTDARADGKPIEARGVIHDGSARAVVQEQLDAALQSTQLARTIFFGQHGGGGLLDKTDAALKAELQALLPLELWESVRETARLQAAAARDEGERMVGEMAAATRQRAQAALQLEAVHAQATAWEQERRTRVNARRAELEALLGSVGTEITEITEITSTVSKAGKDGLVTEEAAAEAGVHAEIAEITEIAEIDTSEAIESAAAEEQSKATLAAANERVRSATARAAEAAARAEEAARVRREAERRAALTALQLGELQEHFGKRGVQNLLYQLALAQLEAAAARYASELSDGRLRLRLAFDEKLSTVRKRVQRLGISCNVLVLDEVMQQMDVDGQAAMARVLKGLQVETTIVIAHGLASDALYGDFEAVDVVEKGFH